MTCVVERWSHDFISLGDQRTVEMRNRWLFTDCWRTDSMSPICRDSREMGADVSWQVCWQELCVEMSHHLRQVLWIESVFFDQKDKWCCVIYSLARKLRQALVVLRFVPSDLLKKHVLEHMIVNGCVMRLPPIKQRHIIHDLPKGTPLTKQLRQHISSDHNSSKSWTESWRTWKHKRLACDTSRTCWRTSSARVTARWEIVNPFCSWCRWQKHDEVWQFHNGRRI